MEHSSQLNGLAHALELVVQQPDGSSRPLTLRGEAWVIGRGAEADLKLPGLAVSRLHARIERHADHWSVTDLNSTNGTYLNGQRLEPDIACPWPVDVELMIGSFALRHRDVTTATGTGVFARPEQATEPTAESDADETTTDSELVQAGVHGSTIVASDDLRFDYTVEEQGNAREHVTTLTLRATGLAPVAMTVIATGGDARIDFRSERWRMRLTPGTPGVTEIIASLHERPLVGRVQRVPFTLHMVTDEGSRQTYTSAVVVRPRITSAYLLLLILLLLLATAALYWLT